MICKKCGSTIEDTSKFCGYCGEKVNNENQTQIPVQNIEQPIVNNVVDNNSLNQTNLNQGVVEQPVLQEVQQNIQVPAEPINNTIPNQTNMPNLESKPSKKKNSKLLFIVLGIVLAVLAAVLVILAFNKTASNSISVLEKSLANLGSKGTDSGTINAKISVEDNTSSKIDLSATLKYLKTNDTYDFGITLNKSVLFEEMSLYLRTTKDKATIYANSNTIDMLGFTKSNVNMWVYYILDLKEVSENIEIPEDKQIDLKGILDEKHFKYVDKTNNTKHYKLIVDKELMDKIKEKMPNDYDEELDSSISLTDSYEIDFYINDSNELVRISMDLTNAVASEDIKSAIIIIE